jgi:hypothetical protein
MPLLNGKEMEARLKELLEETASRGDHEKNKQNTSSDAEEKK